MDTDALLERAQSVWETLAAVPVSFGGSGLTVVAAPDSGLCPPSWTGIVAMGDAAIVTVPTAGAVEPVRRALARLPLDSLTHPDLVNAALPVTNVLGPAKLGYVSPDAFSPARSGIAVERLALDHPDLRTMLQAVDADEAGEAGIDEITSPAFVVREESKVVAAAGYTIWPASTAHLCVLTAAAARGRRYAQHAASEAVAHALAEDLLPQWRARIMPSRRVARALGFTEMGTQLSVQLDLARLADTPDAG